MKWKPYPAYRLSGIEWLGKIPEHWTMKRLKHVTQCLDGRRIPLNAEQRGGMQGDYPYWGANGVVDHIDQWLFDENLVLLGEDGAPFFDPFKRVAFFVTGKIWVNNHAHVLRPLPGIEPRFLTHLLNSVHYGAFIDGSTRDKLTQSDMNEIAVQYPPPQEQNAIAAFLDRETERIDTLIAKKERQIELLREKRSALISQIVTKGVNPKVKMKDSGMSCLSLVPEHWAVKRLKFITPQVTVGIVITPAKYYVDEGVPCLRSLNIRENFILENDLVYISPESNELLSKSKITKGDLVSVRTGQPGTTAVVDERFDGANCIDLIVTRKSKNFDSRFLSYFMNSDFAKLQYSSDSTGAIQAHFNIETAGNMWVAVPPYEEQVH